MFRSPFGRALEQRLESGAAVTPTAHDGGLLESFWSREGRRFTVEAESPTKPNTLTIDVTKDAKAVTRLVVQGHDMPLERPFHGRTAMDIAAQLERTGMCVGVTNPKLVQLAQAHPAYSQQVEDCDGVGLFK